MLVIHACRDLAERLPDYAEGRLPAAERAAIEGHLRTCRKCTDLERQFREVARLMQEAIGPQALRNDFRETTSHRLESVGTYATGPGGVEHPFHAPEPSLLDALARSFGALPWWVISGTFHALLLMLVTLIGLAFLRARPDEAVIVTDLARIPETPPEEPERPRDIFKKPVPVEASEVLTETQPMVVHEEIEIADHAETADESELATARGEEGLSDVMLGGTGTVGSIGLGGGGGGAYGQRLGGGRRRMAARGGGGAATESAVDAALAWLARHQEKEGFWDTDKYLDNKVYRHGGTHGMSTLYDPGISGLSLLAFLGAGHTLKVGKYKPNVQAGIKWLLSVQGPDGDFTAKFRGHKAVQYYGHCIATLACAEALAMNGGRDWGEYDEQGKTVGLREALDKAVKLILEWQDRNPTGGWTYFSPNVTDPTVTGWAIMALKSSKLAGLNVPADSFVKASEALKKITTVQDKAGDYGHAVTGYLSPGALPFGSKGYACTAAGAVAQLFVGADRQEAKIDAAVAFFTQPEALPQWIFQPQSAASDHQNLYYWYYGTLASFQAGGDAWAKWNESMKKALLPHQRKDALKDGSPLDVDGSWDPDDVWGAWGGRVYSTALGALCLEVYYRYLPLYR